MCLCVYGCEPEPIGEMGLHIADSVAGHLGLKPQKLFNFQNFARGEKYHSLPQKLFSISHRLNGQIMHPINALYFFCAKSDKMGMPLIRKESFLVITLNYL